MPAAAKEPAHLWASDAERIAAEEQYIRISEALRVCETLEHLRDAWVGNQADIALMPESWRAELVEWKDYLKSKLGGAA